MKEKALNLRNKKFIIMQVVYIVTYTIPHRH